MVERELSRRERKKLENQNRILDSARELFRIQGFDSTSLNEIAELADVSRATFYNYFPSKDALLNEIAAAEMGELARFVDVDLASEPSALSRIRRAMLLLVTDNIPLLQVTRRVLLESLLRPGEVPDPIARMESILIELVQEAQAQGDVRTDTGAGSISRWIVGAYLAALAFHRWLRADEPGKPVDGSAIETSVHMLFEGLAGPNYCIGNPSGELPRN